MNLSLQDDRVGDVIVVRCVGRIVEGPESTLLDEHLEDVLTYDRCIVLHLAGIDFIDSSGLGLMARFVMRTRMRRAHLKMCALPARIDDLLTVTRLRPIFDVYATEREALASFADRTAAPGLPNRMDPDILCVHESSDVLAFVRTLLLQVGYGVMTTDNLPDALVLVQSVSPKVVLIDSGLRAQRTTSSAKRFNEHLDSSAVIELPPNFSTLDAAATGPHLLTLVERALKTGGLPAV